MVGVRAVKVPGTPDLEFSTEKQYGGAEVA